MWLHISFGLGYVFRNRMLFRMILLYFSVRNSMGTCGYLWGHSKVWNGCFIVCSHQQNVRRTISLPPFQQSLSVALALLRGMKVVWSCSSPAEFSDHLYIFIGEISIQTFIYFWHSFITKLSIILYGFLIQFPYQTHRFASDLSHSMVTVLLFWWCPLKYKRLINMQFGKLNFATEHSVACL